MIKSLIISCFCLLIFSQCGQNTTSNSNNENSNVVTKSTPIPQEFLLGIWKGTEHNTPYPVFLNFKNNNEIEVLNCNTDKKLTLLKYDFYKENEKSAIKINNEEF